MSLAQALQALLSYYAHLPDSILQGIVEGAPAGLLTAEHARDVLQARQVLRINEIAHTEEPGAGRTAFLVGS